ncbi:hypothetical protein [Vibrio sp. WXL210]|uniref:hypothetical protein n=1 Tax=Vibrio sp. WXL210 TaxID=3450709 RepID=UPI003EC7432F
MQVSKVQFPVFQAVEFHDGNSTRIEIFAKASETDPETYEVYIGTEIDGSLTAVKFTEFVLRVPEGRTTAEQIRILTKLATTEAGDEFTQASDALRAEIYGKK